jgi:hypothetical protein
MYEPTTKAGRFLITQIHKGELKERVHNAYELVEVLRLNDMDDEKIIKYTEDYCEDNHQAAIIRAIIIFEINWRFLTDNELVIDRDAIINGSKSNDK